VGCALQVLDPPVRDSISTNRRTEDWTLYHLLYLDLLEGTEASRARLHVQRVMNTVLFALILVLAVQNRGKGLARDILERFGSTDVASVRIHEKKRLDLGHTGDNTPHGDELTEVHSTNIAHSHRVIVRHGPEA
jgi:hypothetical protein